jgi:nucleotide-binding universal stress UspA family protein
MSEIVVGIDDSAGAQDALAFATRFAQATGAALRLVSVFPYSDVPSRAANRTYREYLRSDAQALLDRVAAGVEGIATSTEAIADTSAPHALHAVSERDGVALVVVGSTHHRARWQSSLAVTRMPVRSGPSASATTEVTSPRPHLRWPTGWLATSTRTFASSASSTPPSSARPPS